MAIDFKSIDKRRAILIIVALVMAGIASVLTNNYIEKSSLEKAKVLAGGASSEEIKKLQQHIQVLEQASQQLAANQNALAQAQQQGASQQQQAAVVPTGQLLSVKTPPGKRAITAAIDRLSAVSGMISPGDFVDIIIHLNIPADLNPTKQDQTTSVTLFQDVLVLAVGDSMQPGINPAMQSASSIPVTFALSPHEAGLMSFAQQHGALQLVLRSPMDTQAFLLPVSTWNSLSEYVSSTQGMDLGVRSPKVTEDIIPEKKPEIEIFRGGQ